ncbi:hydroxyphenylacetyl-CoA thioesterase PaaI [Corynebacterium cystitidis]|uniref:hydroxyphenylacetyl-CoA thioesterase PaaI n=1 Tax=Corynebacterium cystitidis TaxID=35757 RepID=UPI00211EB907|nr:hydroxyphenylacetyl-CoA thioesterase PaaI [Corynebacterium cystitidis]
MNESTHASFASDLKFGPGLDFTEEMYKQDRSLKTMGITITAVERGRTEGTMTITPEMCNGHNTIQGGFLFTFADALFAGACNSSAGTTTVASQVGIHFISPGFVGDVLQGVAIERETWGRNGITDVTIFRDDEVIAEFRGTSRTIGKP